MIDILDRALLALNRLYLRLAQLLLAALVAAVFVQVVYRYVFGRSILGLGELTALALVWLVFLMAAVLHRRRRHIVITALVDVLGPRARRFCAVLVSLGTLAFCVFVYVQLVEVWPYLRTSTPVFKIPDWVRRTAPLLAFVPILLQEVVNLSGREPPSRRPAAEG